jgi:hypothetical protein
MSERQHTVELMRQLLTPTRRSGTHRSGEAWVAVNGHDDGDARAHVDVVAPHNGPGRNPASSSPGNQQTRRSDDVPFENLEFDVPEGLTTDDFILRPIVAADAEMDYAAVMESREYLRTWEQSSWPEDDFTVAANRDDLEKLERRHASREAFTYTVMNPAGSECLGCVYIMPSDARMFAEAHISLVGNRRWDDYEAAVYFWIRKSRLATETDRVLLDALRTWLAQDWNLGSHLIVTNEQFAQQVDIIEHTDLQLRFKVEEPDKPGRYLAYE